MGEGKRYFDLRRWMDAPVEESKPVYGLNIMETSANKEAFMEVIPVSNLSASFSDKMYFWPIPLTELNRNKNLTQNPGWKSGDINNNIDAKEKLQRAIPVGYYSIDGRRGRTHGINIVRISDGSVSKIVSRD